MLISRLRLEFAAHCFLAEMRRRYTASHPDSQNPVLNFDDYNPVDRAHIMAAVEKAIISSSDKASPLFEQWLERKNTTD